MQQKFCTKCGNPLIEGDRFCRKCGTPIPGKTAAPVPPAAPEQSQAPEPLRAPELSRAPEQFTGNTYEPVYEQPKPFAAGMNSYEHVPQHQGDNNPEGTTLLVDTLPQQGGQNPVIRAEIRLSLGDVLRGCTKVLDFGTGEKFEVSIPAGLSPGDVLVVKDTGINDPATGMPCDFELTIAMA